MQCLANPFYLNYLAQSQYFENPSFIAYLEYLEYFRQPEYIRLLTYPTYSLNALSMLKQPAFRADIMNPHLAKIMADDGIAGVTALMAEQRGRGIPIATEGDGAGPVAAGAEENNSNNSGGQAGGTDAAIQNGRT